MGVCNWHVSVVSQLNWSSYCMKCCLWAGASFHILYFIFIDIFVAPFIIFERRSPCIALFLFKLLQPIFHFIKFIKIILLIAVQSPQRVWVRPEIRDRMGNNDTVLVWHTGLTQVSVGLCDSQYLYWLFSSSSHYNSFALSGRCVLTWIMTALTMDTMECMWQVNNNHTDLTRGSHNLYLVQTHPFSGTKQGPLHISALISISTVIIFSSLGYHISNQTGKGGEWSL